MTSIRALVRFAGVALAIVLAGFRVQAETQPGAPALHGFVATHDPSTVIKCKDKYYCFGTGRGIQCKVSQDRILWSAGSSVFSAPPAWTTNAVRGFRNFYWAPDVIYFNGLYRLYYSVSSWGSQVSAIGLATNPTLDAEDPAYKWTDCGPVISSKVGSPYNTIDPSVALDADGKPWMAFGSFWQGIYVVQLDKSTGLRVAPDSPTWRVAYNSSIEAACICRHGSYYYLFVNWGACCKGVNSTYEVRVGRSTNITGPHLDRAGRDLAANGGSLFLESTGKFTGPGHIGFLSEDGHDWISYHYYDAGTWSPQYRAYGASMLDLEPLSWSQDGWPVFVHNWSAVYRFQEDAFDENGEYTGTLMNGAAIQPDGNRGRVLNLDGTSQYVQLPPGVAYARTFSALINWRGGAPGQRIFDLGTDSSNYLMLTPSDENGKLRCEIRTNDVVQAIEIPTALPSNSWTHVAVTMDGAKGVLYLNGAPVSTNSGMTILPINVHAQANYLGRSRLTNAPYFNGQFANFRVDGGALSEREIGDIFRKASSTVIIAK